MKGNWRKTDRQWSTPNTHINPMHIFLAHTCSDTDTHTLSSRQQGPVSDHDRAWMCSVVRANDLRHMSSPCGFKTKHCQECSALAGQPAPCSAVLGMRRAIQSQVQDETHHLPFTSFCSLPLFFRDCCRLCVCCSHLSGCRRFACEAREGAATPRRLSPFTLPAVGEAVWRARDRRKGRKGRRRGRDKEEHFLF